MYIYIYIYMTVGYDKKVVKKIENGQLLISKKVKFVLF